MKKQNKKMSNAIFLVTGEKSCPYYDTGDEIKVESNSVSISSFKPVCVYLTAQIEKILSAPGFAGSHSPFGGRQFSPKAQQTQASKVPQSPRAKPKAP